MESTGRKVQYLSTFCVSLASLCLGATSTWPSPVLPKLSNNETDVKITDHEIAWLVAINPIGYMLGSLISGYMADKFGRKSTILISALPLTTGTIIAILATKPFLLYITRFLWGCGTAIVGMSVTMYIGEVADKEIRGSLMLITKVLFNLGGLIMMIVGPIVSYKCINIFLLVLPGCYFLACWFIPESPYYYLKDGKFDLAGKVLKKFRGFKDRSILEDELTTIHTQVQNDMKRSTSLRELFTGRACRKALIIAAVLRTVKIMMGGGTIRIYLGKIMQESEANISIKTVLMVFGIVSFLVVMLSTVLVDRISRRTLLVYGSLVYATCLLFVAAYFFFKEVIEIEIDSLRQFGFIPFVGIIFTNIISNLAIDSVIFIIPGEIFSTNIKAIALSTLNVYAGILGFVASHTYQIIKDFSGLTGVFLVFSTVTYYGSVFVYFFLPETKSKSLHEILKEFQGIYYNKDNNIKVNTHENNEKGNLIRENTRL